MSTVKKAQEESYYPGSKIVYDEQNKSQASGKVATSKAKVDVSDPAVVAANEGKFDKHKPSFLPLHHFNAAVAKLWSDINPCPF